MATPLTLTREPHLEWRLGVFSPVITRQKLMKLLQDERDDWQPSYICQPASDVSGNYTNELSSVKILHKRFFKCWDLNPEVTSQPSTHSWALNVQKMQFFFGLFLVTYIYWNIYVEDWHLTYATFDILFSVFSLKVSQHQKIGSNDLSTAV